MGFFTLPKPNIQPTFTIDPEKFNTTASELVKIIGYAHQPKVISGKVIITHHYNSTPEQQDESLLSLFNTIGIHQQ